MQSFRDRPIMLLMSQGDTEQVALVSRRYTDQELADMARRLDECIEVSALCMDLALAGEMHRAALLAQRTSEAVAAKAAPGTAGSGGPNTGPP
jgi:hypothetical protein